MCHLAYMLKITLRTRCRSPCVHAVGAPVDDREPAGVPAGALRATNHRTRPVRPRRVRLRALRLPSLPRRPQPGAAPAARHARRGTCGEIMIRDTKGLDQVCRGKLKINE